MLSMHELHAGLFLATHTVGEALKGGRLVAAVMAREGYNVFPAASYGTAHARAALPNDTAVSAQHNRGSPGDSTWLHLFTHLRFGDIQEEAVVSRGSGCVTRAALAWSI